MKRMACHVKWRMVLRFEGRRVGPVTSELKVPIMFVIHLAFPQNKNDLAQLYV